MGLKEWTKEMLIPIEDEIDLTQTLCQLNIFQLIDSYLELKEEIASVRDYISPALRRKYEVSPFEEVLSVLYEMREKVQEISNLEDRSPYLGILNETLKRCYELTDKYNSIIADKDKDYTILAKDPVSGKPLIKEYKSTPSSNTALQELKKLSQRPGISQIRIPKDLMETQTHSVGDTLEYITDPQKKDKIKKLQAEGKLLAGTLEGLSGGTAYLKSFTIALAQTLNEQSKYYKTEEDYSGVPTSLIPDIFGEKVEVEENPVSIRVRESGDKEKRRIPYILVSYEGLASKMRGKGKKRGGKDSVQIREYIETLSGKEYLLDGGRGVILGIPFLTKRMTIYRGDTGEEVGCLLSLSPQFSRTLRGYTGLRADTIQLIGGGRQKDITMSLLDLLLYVRGADRGNIWRKNKEELLSRIATSKRYQRQKGERERDFRTAIQKVKDSGLILDYREDTSTSGETISVFAFNPNYSKSGGETPDVQNGE